MTTQHRTLRPVLAVLPLALAGCAAPSVDATLRAQRFELDGDLGASSGPVAATSSVDRLGLGDDSWEFAPRVDLVGGPVRLTVDAFRTEFEGEGTADADFTIGGETITAGTDVTSRLELGFARAALTFTILPLSIVHIGLGIGVAVADLEAELQEQITLETVATDETAAVPFIAARVGGSFWRVSFDVLAGYLEVDIDDVDARYLDIEALARLRLFDAGFHGDLVAGYRWMDFDVEYDDGGDRVEADLELSGPFVGVSVGL